MITLEEYDRVQILLGRKGCPRYKKHQFALEIGKDKAWKSDVTYEGFTKFGLSYIEELGLLEIDDRDLILEDISNERRYQESVNEVEPIQIPQGKLPRPKPKKYGNRKRYVSNPRRSRNALEPALNSFFKGCVRGNTMSLKQIKTKLSKCCKEHKPVLLHGEVNIGRLDLIHEVHQEVHTENVSDKKEPNSAIFLNEIGEQLSKAVYDELNKRLVAQGFDMSEGSSTDVLGDTKVLEVLDILRIEIDAWDKARNFRIQEGSFMTESELNAFAAKGMLYQIIVENESKVREYFKSTKKTYLQKNYESDNGKGKEVYDFLVKKNVLKYIEIPHASFLKMSFFSVPIFGSILYDFEGTVFLGNLHYDPCNEEDNEYYKNLGNIIEERKLVNWLVIYADVDDPEIFPKEFRDRFEPILLSDKAVMSVKEVRSECDRTRQTNARRNLSKGLEYIRWDEGEEKFYTKVKDKEREKELDLTGQPYQIFNYLFIEYDSKTKKASVPIDEVLYQAGIKGHKKEGNISKDKRDHLSVKITLIKDELEDAGFDRDCIKINKGVCELYIECLDE